MAEEMTLGELIKTLLENRPLKLFLAFLLEAQRQNLEAYHLNRVRGVELVRRG
jgi:hypothetical protein